MAAHKKRKNGHSKYRGHEHNRQQKGAFQQREQIMNDSKKKRTQQIKQKKLERIRLIEIRSVDDFEEASISDVEPIGNFSSIRHNERPLITLLDPNQNKLSKNSPDLKTEVICKKELKNDSSEENEQIQQFLLDCEQNHKLDHGSPLATKLIEMSSHCFNNQVQTQWKPYLFPKVIELPSQNKRDEGCQNSNEVQSNFKSNDSDSLLLHKDQDLESVLNHRVRNNYTKKQDALDTYVASKTKQKQPLHRLFAYQNKSRHPGPRQLNDGLDQTKFNDNSMKMMLPLECQNWCEDKVEEAQLTNTKDHFMKNEEQKSLSDQVAQDFQTANLVIPFKMSPTKDETSNPQLGRALIVPKKRMETLFPTLRSNSICSQIQFGIMGQQQTKSSRVFFSPPISRKVFGCKLDYQLSK